MSCFNPLLESHTLDQEGWHFELEGPNAPLSYKGVVFNEMKGAYSLQDAHIGDQVTRALLPNTIYANSSGGDPRHIPELSHAELARIPSPLLSSIQRAHLLLGR